MAAIQTSRLLEAEGRPATAEEQQTLARWSSWGAIPQVFDDTKPEWAREREQLRELLDDRAYDAARRTTINAHYTDASYVDQIWITLTELGFTGGDVLEPGCGAGTFIGMAPAGARMVGIELDPTTAAIAHGLYPDADIRAESFASTRFPRDHFDAVVGNVPFADVTLHDPVHNPGQHTMHNHFIIKSLAMTRPGGMVAVLTSSFTMDATNPAARREMNAQADLVGAVRLPSGAHRRAAGTEALTDLLLFRKRADGVPPADLTWETVTPREVDGKVIRVNNYFDEHPDHVLGQFHVGTGMYGGETVSVLVEDLSTVDGRLAVALSDVVRQARDRGQVFTEVTPEAVQARTQAVSDLTELWDGSIVADPQAESGFRIAAGGRLEPLAVPKTQAVELRALLGLRDGARSLLEAEAADVEDTPELEAQRTQLRGDYEAYVAKYGPLNRYTLRGTGRYEPLTNPETGEVVLDPATGQPERGVEQTARITPRALVTFRQDPHSALVRALERFDEEAQTSSPASLLVQRVVVPRPLKQGAETPAEAIALSLDETGDVDLQLIARLLGVAEDEARIALGDMVYDDPVTGDLVHAPDYLSGDVRTKLDAAVDAAATDDRFRVNVEALTTVLPDPIGVEEIEARLGAVWISAELHQQFLTELLEDRTVRVENPMPGEWEVRGARWGIRATNDWGTERRPATDIAQSLMEQKRIEVSDEVEGPDGRKRRVLNPVETTAAQEKADALQERFSEWVWEDPQRASELAAIYNRRFNSIRLRDYTTAGDYLSLPGLAESLTLRPHQRAAVARMIAEPAVGLFHQVGAGKAQPMDAPVLTPSGFRRMGDLMVGESVITVDGSATPIVGVYPQGPKDVYKVTFSDGATVECNDEHLWTVSTPDWRAAGIAPKTLTLRELMSRGLRNTKGQPKWDVPIAAAAEFDGGRDRPLDPYLLGILIGDGNFAAASQVGFSTADPEVVAAVESTLPFGYVVKKSATRRYDYKIVGAVRLQRNANEMVRSLHDLDLMGKTSHYKHIPLAYREAPTAVRLAVLQGVMDADGTVDHRSGSMSLSTVSARLAEDVAWLVRSLGGVARVRPRSRANGTSLDVSVSFDNGTVPFRLSRKAEKVRDRSRPVRRAIVTVEQLGVKPMQCIAVAHESHLYVTEGFVVTHNTLEMVCGATEMKRMGLVSKPAVVVPNHMLEQFSREWLQAYPRARVLAASTQDLTGDKRRLFVARAAANDWDAIILTQGAFKKIGLSADFEARYIDQQLVELRAGLEAAREADSMSVKRIEKRILAVEERHKKALAMPRDPGLSFEDTGIDYLVVDEAHMYKNLATVSNIRDAAIEGSQQATDLHMKLEYLRQRHGDRVATMATATPLANSVTEAYVMQRYLRPDLLAAAGVTSFDGWAATFGSQVTEMEMGPAGGFRLKTRFSKFQNVPEMLRMWHVFADVKTAEDLNLPVPELAPRASDGKRDVETVVLDPTPELEDYIAQIADRAEKVASRQVDASEDNMLLISTDGRKAALDLRLVDQAARQSGTVKLDAVASRILDHWKQTRDNVYLDEVTGESSPIRGGLQLVFSDLGTPHETRWDAYTELRSKLIEGGMAPDAVRFIHEAKNDAAKARLFASARSGHVAVLIGSTAKMGVGTNVQNRLTAMHHVDCPWRPADLEQRDGRGIRQGNQNAEVAIYRYVVERSFDAYSWQTVGRKATFIAQVMRGRLDTREIDDIGDTALSAAEAKALASGNPLVLEKANAEAAYQKLRRQEVAHHRAQAALRQTRHVAEGNLEARSRDVDELRAAAARTVDTSGDAFRMKIGSTTLDNRVDAAAAAAAWAMRNQQLILSTTRHDEPVVMGAVGGHEVTIVGDRAPAIDRNAEHMVMIGLAEVPGSAHRTTLRELQGASVGLIRSIENKTGAIEKRIGLYEAEIAEDTRVLADVEAKLDKPFPHAEDLVRAKDRLDQVNAELAAQAEPEGTPGAEAVAAPEPELSPAARAALEAAGHGRVTTAASLAQPAASSPGGDLAAARVDRTAAERQRAAGPTRRQ
ncbi:hypothetical protein GCM10028801_44530 [Nocardioides maradonensis]